MSLSSVKSEDRLAQPAVLELKVLQAFHLLGLQPAKLLAPPIIRHLAHPDLANCVHHVLALRDQNIDLPQLRDDLFRLVSLPAITVLLDVKDIPQVGPLQWGRIIRPFSSPPFVSAVDLTELRSLAPTPQQSPQAWDSRTEVLLL